jgi:superfamily I DNA/RNA helicase
MSDHRMELGAAERSVLELDRGRALVTGPPGSGKTTLLRERFARLIEGGADPERVALFALSRRAAREARDRLIRSIGRSLPDVPAFTVHGFAYRIVVGARFADLGYEDEPDVLSAPEQYAAVRDMLGVERRTDWPAFGHLLPVPAFARQVADFVLRCQEHLFQPEEVEAMVEESGRDDYQEVAAFYRRYLDALGAAGQVDFAGLLSQAVSVQSADPTAASFDHVLVDDYQDATHATEAVVGALAGAATTVVVAADPNGHVFSYRGGSLDPLRRVARTLPGIREVSLRRSYRLNERVDGLTPLADPTLPAVPVEVSGIDARVFAHPGEEAEAVAHELLRFRVDEDITWGDMAVVLRRYGPYITALRHALSRHSVPFVVVGEQATLSSEPVIRPVIDLLRYAFRDELREQLLEPLLGSPIGGFDPHELRRLRREARIRDRTLLELVHGEDGGRAVAGELGARLTVFRELVDDIERGRGSVPLDELFFRLWRTLPYFRALVAAESEHERELDVVSAFAATIRRFVERRSEASVEDYLAALEAAEFGPDPWITPEERRPAAVRVISAHRAQGTEFEVVIVAGCLEGEFPSLAYGSSLLSLDALADPQAPSERIAARLSEERALFRLAASRARGRTLLFASRSTGSRTPRTPSRFATRMGCAWLPGEEPTSRPATSLRGMEASLRRRLASSAEDPAVRLAATAAAENMPCARRSTGLPTASDRTPSALIATSSDPDDAPRKRSTAASPPGEVATAGRKPQTANTAAMPGSTPRPSRSMSTPAKRIAASAPAPMQKSAAPSAASLAPACVFTAGRSAPQAPQKTPRATKPTSVRARPVLRISPARARARPAPRPACARWRDGT